MTAATEVSAAKKAAPKKKKTKAPVERSARNHPKAPHNQPFQLRGKQ